MVELIMSCHVCGAEAVGRCYNCGLLYCDQHGDGTCARCDTGFREGDPRQDLISAAPRAAAREAAWWRPQPAEEYAPPACYHCRGIARQVCPHCHELFCPEHAGKNGMCAQCSRSSLLGIAILVAVAAIFGVLMLVGLFLG